jgi:protein tyrosine/serine phosphatase
MLRILVFILLAIALILSARPPDISSSGNIPRFSLLATNLYRGGQPTEEGFQFLKDNGIKTIVNLRGEDNSESGIVRALGMNYVQIPVGEIGLLTRIPEAAIEQYFKLVGNPANYPIFFHCRRGADRTGTLAALYRIRVEGWNADKAYREARDVGMRWYFAGLRSQIYGL